jgi:hypothetical protein
MQYEGKIMSSNYDPIEFIRSYRTRIEEKKITKVLRLEIKR